MPKGKGGGAGGVAGKGLSSTLQAAGGKFTKVTKRVAKKRAAPASDPAPHGRKPAPVFDAKGKAKTVQETPAANRPTPTERQVTHWQANNLPNARGKRGAEDALRSSNPIARDAADVGRRRSELINYPRQSFTPKQRQEVWDSYFGEDATKGTDVGGRTIYRDDHRPAGEKSWQMGHVGGHEHWKNVQKAIDDGADPQSFKDDYNNTANYRPEHQITNGSHQHEDD